MTTATKTKLAANTTTSKASKAEAVVLNDNYKKQTLATLNDLVSKRENWETTVQMCIRDRL